MDEHLNWKNHVDHIKIHIASKCLKMLSVLNKLKNVLPINVKNIYLLNITKCKKYISP